MMNEHERNMQRKERKEFIGRMIKGTALSCVMALVIYIAECIVLANVLDDAGNALPMLLLQIAYLIAVYSFYISHEAQYFYSPEGRTGKAKAILTDYVRTEGRMLLWGYGILAVLAEFMKWILPAGGGNNPVVFLAMLTMPLSAAIPIPILRMVIGYTGTISGILSLTVLARKKVR